MYPVAHIVEFEIPEETGKAGAELFEGWIKRPQAVHLAPNVKGRLGDLRAFPGRRQIEIRFGGAVVIQSAVETATLELSDIMSDVIGFCP